MNYEIELTDDADADIERHKKSGDKVLLRKIDKLFDENNTFPVYMLLK